MKTAREIAEFHLNNKTSVDKLEYDILRHLEHHYGVWRKSEISIRVKMLEDLLQIGSEREFNGVAWENLLTEKINLLKQLK